jgi:hypothetical protein
MSSSTSSVEYKPSFDDPTVYESLVPPTSVMATMGNDTVIMPMSKVYSFATGVMVGSAAWVINRQIVSRRAPSSIFAKVSTTTTNTAISRPIARTASGSILFSSPVAAAAWTPFAMPILVPMFRTSNTAGVAFLRPISNHHSISPSTATRLLASAPSTQTIVVASFLAFVGYKNYIYYQQHPFTDDE